MSNPISESKDALVSAWPQAPKVKLDVWGAEAPLPEMESEMQRSLHGFAEKVMRPVGMALDKLSADEVIAQGSPYWHFVEEFGKLGLTPSALMGLSPEERGRVFPIIMEECGWGDAGLSIVIGACSLPSLMARVFNRKFLIDRFPESLRGCWAITEPQLCSHPQGRQDRDQRSEVGLGFQRAGSRSVRVVLRRRYGQWSGYPAWHGGTGAAERAWRQQGQAAGQDGSTLLASGRVVLR
jgi:hypothetical protein